MKFEQLQQALQENHDSFKSIGLVEVPSAIYQLWSIQGHIKNSSLDGCPVFEGDEGVLYQRLNKDVVRVSEYEGIIISNNAFVNGDWYMVN